MELDPYNTSWLCNGSRVHSFVALDTLHCFPKLLYLQHYYAMKHE